MAEGLQEEKREGRGVGSRDLLGVLELKTPLMVMLGWRALSAHKCMVGFSRGRVICDMQQMESAGSRRESPVVLSQTLSL